ncbi:PfkB family carbohydrate kinase [Methylocapsa sp. S129]|uniref:PfkB family carbohydrate kinase n=1 Tax=Methylocapsa sp. S129 TaxID=1641869 RepID=UPI00131BAD1B|nr:PfkB family carbohydrate kinase [Methylocapsa sp. S129]
MALIRPLRLMSVGSILADIRMEVPHLPERGGDILGSAATVSAGGGFNILAAAARNGLETIFAGRHGVGPYGARIRAELAREGISTLLAPDPERDSGFCVVLVEPDGERTFITSPGAEAQLGARSLEDIPLRDGDAIFVSGYDLCYPDLGSAIASWIGALSHGVLLVVDPGPLVAQIPPDVLAAVLPRTGIWTLNQREARIFSGAGDIGAIADNILPRLAAGALLVLRNGAEGCDVASAGPPSSFAHLSSPDVAMVDSTGAGDAHTGVLIAGLAAGLDPFSAAMRANAAAAISVTRRGPATAPDKQELDAFLAARDPRREKGAVQN